MTDIVLYEYGPSRSSRCRWALLEAGLPFTAIDCGPEAGNIDELLKIHPQAKVPAATFDGEALFESAAICTHIADLAPEAGLIGPAGSRERALHDQWISFTLSEMEAWLWSTGINSFVLPEGKRITAHLEQNATLFRRGAKVMDNALAEQDYLVANRFSVTDIFVGFAVQWGRGEGLIDDFANLQNYLKRLSAREHSTLRPVG